MIKELTQLDQGAFPGKPVVIPLDPDILTDEDRHNALEVVNIIERNRNGNIKGRSCTNGSKQRTYLKGFDSVVLTTVSVQGLFMMLMIGACEGIKFVSFDVPGAFLQAEIEDDKMVVLKF